MPSGEELNRWALPLIVGAILTAIFGGVVTLVVGFYSSDHAEIGLNHTDLATLKVQEATTESALADLSRRTDGEVASINTTIAGLSATLNDALEGIRSIKQSGEAQTDALREVEKRLADIDNVLRPIIHLPGGR